MARFSEFEPSPTFQILLQNSSAGYGRKWRRWHRFVWPTLSVVCLILLGVVLLIYFRFHRSGAQVFANPYFTPETKLRFSPVNGESSLILAETVAKSEIIFIRHFSTPHNCSTITRSLPIPRGFKATYGVTEDCSMIACFANQTQSICALYNPYNNAWDPRLISRKTLKNPKQPSYGESPPNQKDLQSNGLNVNIGGVMVNDHLILQGYDGKLQVVSKKFGQPVIFNKSTASFQFPNETCLISVDSSHIITTGGFHNVPLKDTYHFVLRKNQLFDGFPMPKLNHRRGSHGCNKVSLLNQTWLVVGAGTGHDGVDRNDMEMLPWKPSGYNQSDRWIVLKAKLHYPRSRKPVLAMLGNQLLVAGGYSKIGVNIVEVFDPDSQKWTNSSIKVESWNLQGLQVNPSRCQHSRHGGTESVRFPSQKLSFAIP